MGPRLQVAVGILASALLLGVYARGGAAWPLGFVALLPWLVVLERVRTLRGALLSGVGMAMAFVGAVFAWFAPAVADYTGWPVAAAFVMLLVLAPLLQPQFVAYALVRHLSRRRAPLLRAVLAIAAWLATEWAVPRLFGDTLGHGLHPAPWLRQAADLAGAAGLTLALLAANEALAAAVARRREGRRMLAPLAVALALPAMLAGYGAMRLSTLDAAAPGVSLRIGLVQASIVDYERLRAEMGAYAVVRHVLDTHYALSRQAREVQRVDALVWSETVYPTTFGQPRSADGAALDAEITAFARQSGVPLVFGTYARDDAGEYNVAAFVDPLQGPLGAYRKTRLFPLTEYVPPAIDGPALRRALPWAGTWRPGDGARVIPLRTADGRDVPVVPLICRDDVDPRLALDGARLGAQLIVGLSNDAWFTDHPQGARLHLQVAAFRSIETRLPQVRATTNGMSAVVDATGAILARTAMGERTVLVAEVQAREPPRTWVVRLDPWLGPLSAALLAGAVLAAAAAAWRRRRPAPAVQNAPGVSRGLDARVLLLARWQRLLLASLRLFARGAVLVLAAVALMGDEASRGMLAQIRQFALFVLAPELLAMAIAWAASAHARVQDGHLVLESRRRRVEIPLRSLAQVRAWRLPLPAPGVDLVLAAGGRWAQGLALRDPRGLVDALVQAGWTPTTSPPASPRRAALARALAIAPRRFDAPLLKFVLFPLVPALPAFRLHQHIAYGGTFGEYYSFGAGAYLTALAMWWASWAVALVLLAGGLRLVVEAASATTLALHPARTADVRRRLLGIARLVYFVGVPGWLLVRLLAG